MWDQSRRRFTSTLVATLAGVTASALLFAKRQSKSNEEKSESDLLRHELANVVMPDPSGNLTLFKPGYYAELRVNRILGLITKTYRHRGTNVNGEEILLNERLLQHRYLREKEGYERLAAIGCRFLPEHLTFDDIHRRISMKYYGPDLLSRMEKQGLEFSTQMQKQLLQVFADYRRAGFLKWNLYRSNLLWDEANERLVPIDYAEHVPRTTQNFLREMYNLASTLPRFPKILEQGEYAFSDFPREMVKPVIRAAFQPLGPREPLSSEILAAKI